MLPENPRILLVKLADIGDVLLCTPAIWALRTRYPHAQIDLLTPPSSAAVLRQAPEIDNVIVFNKFPFDTLGSLFNVRVVLGALGFLLGLGRQRYDAILLFHHYTLRFGALKFAAVALASRAPIRAGVDNGRGWFLTHRVADKGFGALHEADYWLAVAAQAGADARPADRRITIPIGATDHAAAAALLADLDLPGSSPLIAIASRRRLVQPGAPLACRTFCHADRYAGAGARRRGAAAGRTDERDLAAEVRSLVPDAARAHVHTVAGRTSIAGTAALVQRCTLFIGNDSGPMHIAGGGGHAGAGHLWPEQLARLWPLCARRPAPGGAYCHNRAYTRRAHCAPGSALHALPLSRSRPGAARRLRPAPLPDRPRPRRRDARGRRPA